MFFVCKLWTASHYGHDEIENLDTFLRQGIQWKGNSTNIYFAIIYALSVIAYNEVLVIWLNVELNVLLCLELGGQTLARWFLTKYIVVPTKTRNEVPRNGM